MCGEHFIDGSGNSADQVYAGFSQKIVESFANRATDDNPDAQFLDFAGAFENGRGFDWDGPVGNAPLYA
jgi:hypothetical protein